MSDPSPRAARPTHLAGSSAAASIHSLRRIAKLEGVSFLILLGIAMPLKYLAHQPLAVKIVGWAHGVLFVIFLVALARARKTAGLSPQQCAVTFIAALLPFGPFIIDRRLEREASNRPPSAGK